jgi:hypothetical protein
MNSIEAINKALPILLQYKNLEDEDLVNVLVENDFSAALSRKLVLFMPIAFGRVFLSKLKVNVSDEYECYQKKGIFTDKQRRKLINEPVYKESLKIAAQMAGKETTGQTFLTIAFRSAEVNAVNQMELQGVNPERVVLTPILTEWEIDEEPQSYDAESTQEKNWWKFWK